MKDVAKTAFIFDPLFLEHYQLGHPESPDRLVAIMNELDRQGLIGQMVQLPVREATENELTLCHSPAHISTIRGTGGILDGIVGPDAYVNPLSWKCATTAAGSLIELSEKVAVAEYKNGFAFVRPPGHHALKNLAMGFCLFGNVAIAAKALLSNKLANRVAIVDFDVHHGNGTQALTQDDPDILFISSHQYPFYPGSGNINETGTGLAKGTVVNLPLPCFSGDGAARAVYSQIAFPSIRRFHPDVILVSAGYDAHWKDPLAQLQFTSSAYAWLSQQLVAIAGEICCGKIVFVLEGGYHTEALAESVANSVKALLGIDNFSDQFGPATFPGPDIGELIPELKRVHNLG